MFGYAYHICNHLSSTRERVMHSIEPSCALFARHLHDQFHVEQGHIPRLALELVEAETLPSPPGFHAFSLVFRGPPAPFLSQASYRFQHHALNTFDMFIAPIRQDQHGHYYEAVFKRLGAERPS